MKTSTAFAKLFIVSFWMGLTQAQESTAPFATYQLTLGFGKAISFENDVFNVPFDVKGSPDIGVNLGFYRHLNQDFAAGFQIYGTTQEIPGFAITDNTGTTKRVTFDLSTFMLAVHGRWFFSRGAVQPYAFGHVGFASASVESQETGTLSASGLGAGIGAGLEIPFARSFSVSLEGILVLGTAKWKQKPFLNSTSDQYNPSMVGLSLNLSYWWGEE